MNDIGIRKMRVFMSAVNEGSFTRASVQQNISQPAATIIINQIEESISAQLFVRKGNSRKAILTETGQKVAEAFSMILANYDTELIKIGNIGTTNKETCKVLIQSPFGALISDKWLKAIAGGFPEYGLHFIQCSRVGILEQIKSKDAQIGVIDGEVSEASIDYEHLATANLVLMANESSSASGTSSISLKDLPFDTVILTGFAEFSARRLQRFLNDAGRHISSFTMVDGMDLIRTLIQKNAPPVILPDLIANRFAPMFGQRVFEFENALVQMPVGPKSFR